VHVVGHDVGDDAEPGARGSGNQRIEVLARAELGVERPVIDDVVAVPAAGPGAEPGRGVQARDSQVDEVVDDAGGIAESEAGLELQPVGRRGQVGPPS
jgi:hypothetical protein